MGEKHAILYRSNVDSVDNVYEIEQLLLRE